MAKSPSARKGPSDPSSPVSPASAPSAAPTRSPDPAPTTPSPTAPARSQNGNKPVHAIRYRGCEAAIWKNTSDKGPFYAVTVRKSYKDAEGQWHDAQLFLTSDLPMLAKAVTDAHSWIAWQERREQPGADKPKGGQS